MKVEIGTPRSRAALSIRALSSEPMRRSRRASVDMRATPAMGVRKFAVRDFDGRCSPRFDRQGPDGRIHLANLASYC